MIVKEERVCTTYLLQGKVAYIERFLHFFGTDVSPNTHTTFLVNVLGAL